MPFYAKMCRMFSIFFEKNQKADKNRKLNIFIVKIINISYHKPIVYNNGSNPKQIIENRMEQY